MCFLTKWEPLLCIFELSVKRIWIQFWMTSRFILKQLDYSLSISMYDSWLGLRPRQLSCNRNLELIIQLFNRNTSDSLGEREMLWDGECFHSFFKFSQTSTSVSIITSTACASSVFLLSYGNTILNQSAHIFSLAYFLELPVIRECCPIWFTKMSGCYWRASKFSCYLPYGQPPRHAVYWWLVISRQIS